jgi:DNA polymerase elongation subunit (family B)
LKSHAIVAPISLPQLVLELQYERNTLLNVNSQFHGQIQALNTQVAHLLVENESLKSIIMDQNVQMTKIMNQYSQDMRAMKDQVESMQKHMSSSSGLDLRNIGEQ